MARSWRIQIRSSEDFARAFLDERPEFNLNTAAQQADAAHGSGQRLRLTPSLTPIGRRACARANSQRRVQGRTPSLANARIRLSANLATSEPTLWDHAR